jgi:hypothetical protein
LAKFSLRIQNLLRVGFDELKKMTNLLTRRVRLDINRICLEWGFIFIKNNTVRKSASGVCVFITAGPVIKLCAGGGEIQAPPDRNEKDECFDAA